MDVLKMFVAGLVTIGLATAILQKGRTTTDTVKAVGDAGSNLLGTAING